MAKMIPCTVYRRVGYLPDRRVVIEVGDSNDCFIALGNDSSEHQGPINFFAGYSGVYPERVGSAIGKTLIPYNVLANSTPERGGQAYMIELLDKEAVEC